MDIFLGNTRIFGGRDLIAERTRWVIIFSPLWPNCNAEFYRHDYYVFLDSEWGGQACSKEYYKNGIRRPTTLIAMMRSQDAKPKSPRWDRSTWERTNCKSAWSQLETPRFRYFMMCATR
jgi:hypothetical protein